MRNSACVDARADRDLTQASVCVHVCVYVCACMRVCAHMHVHTCVCCICQGCDGVKEGVYVIWGLCIWCARGHSVCVLHMWFVMDGMYIM